MVVRMPHDPASDGDMQDCRLMSRQRGEPQQPEHC